MAALYAFYRAGQLQVKGDGKSADTGYAPIEQLDIIQALYAADLAFQRIGHINIVSQTYKRFTLGQVDVVLDHRVLDLAADSSLNRGRYGNIVLEVQRNILRLDSASDCPPLCSLCHIICLIRPLSLLDIIRQIGTFKRFDLIKLGSDNALRIYCSKCVVRRRPLYGRDVAADAHGVSNKRLWDPVYIHGKHLTGSNSLSTVCYGHRIIADADGRPFWNDYYIFFKCIGAVIVLVDGIARKDGGCVLQHGFRLCHSDGLLWQEIAVFKCKPAAIYGYLNIIGIFYRLILCVCILLILP